MKDEKSSAPWWIALGVGTGLILFPEPATTGAGILIVLAAVGVKASEIAEGVIGG